MPNNQPEQSQLDLTNFAKSVFEGNDEYNLLKNPNDEKHFEPVNNGFYGFSIDLSDVCWRNAKTKEPIEDVIDIDYEDLTNQKSIEK